MTENTKERMRKLLLEELKTGTPQWYYISVAGEEFQGGFVLRGYGPTDAWLYLHRLGLYPLGSGFSTQTCGPIDEAVMQKIPEEKRWRRLNKEEATNLGES